MVLLWSLVSLFDLVRYGLGFTDKFQGCGVFESFTMERTPKPAIKNDDKQVSSACSIDGNNTKKASQQDMDCSAWE